jgi:GGDEF domain-containing protein
LARALARAIERQGLLDRLEELEGEIARRQIVDEGTGLYASWRFDEDWRLEQIRANRRGGDLSTLMVMVETSPPIAQMSPRDRATTLRATARAMRAVMRDGDIAAHDGGGAFRIMLVDASTSIATGEAEKVGAALREALRSTGTPGTVTVQLADSFDTVTAGAPS